MGLALPRPEGQAQDAGPPSRLVPLSGPEAERGAAGFAACRAGAVCGTHLGRRPWRPVQPRALHCHTLLLAAWPGGGRPEKLAEFQRAWERLCSRGDSGT
uniref:Uncharacterized protein n=1 Tax=Alexandrium monilatum TaxID=311494 RepID=A0A6T0WPH2_9DINO